MSLPYLCISILIPVELESAFFLKDFIFKKTPKNWRTLFTIQGKGSCPLVGRKKKKDSRVKDFLKIPACRWWSTDSSIQWSLSQGAA